MAPCSRLSLSELMVNLGMVSERERCEAIHNAKNIIKLPHGAGSIHAKISGFYSSKQAFTGGKTVRQWLSTQSYQQQYEFGIKTLKQFGWKP